MLVTSFFNLLIDIRQGRSGCYSAFSSEKKWKHFGLVWSFVCAMNAWKAWSEKVMHLSAVEHFQKTQPGPFLLCFLNKNINPIAVKTEAKCQFASRQYPSVVCIAAIVKIHCQKHLLIDEVRALILCNGFSAFPFYSCLPWKKQSCLQVNFLSDIDEPSKFASGQCQFEHKHLILVEKNRGKYSIFGGQAVLKVNNFVW